MLNSSFFVVMKYSLDAGYAWIASAVRTLLKRIDYIEQHLPPAAKRANLVDPLVNVGTFKFRSDAVPFVPFCHDFNSAGSLAQVPVVLKPSPIVLELEKLVVEEIVTQGNP